MTNLLVEYDRSIPTVLLLRQTMSELTCYANINLRFKNIKTIDVNDVNWSDIILSIRGNSLLSRDLARAAKKQGKFYILYSDDDLYELPKNYLIHPKRINNFQEILNYADIILANNQLLAEKMCRLGECNRYVLVDSIVDENEFVDPPQLPSEEKTSFVYAAGVDHEVYFEAYIAPALSQLPTSIKSRMSITFIGVHPKLSKTICDIETRFIPLLPLEEYRDFMKVSRFVVGLAPLPEGGFSQYKYANKYLEYTLMGIAGIYSDCMPYTQVVCHKKNGLLCKNDPESWRSAIEQVVEASDLIQRCASNAQADVRERCNKLAVCDKLLESVPELISFAAASKASETGQWKISQCKNALFRIFEVQYLAWNYFCRRGPKGLWRKVSQHLLFRGHNQG